MLGVFHGALHFGLVVRPRKRLLSADKVGIVAVDGIEQLHLLVGEGK